MFRVEAKVRAEVSHIKLGGEKAWGQAARVLKRVDDVRAEGLDITLDQYVYTASSTSMSQLIPDWAFDGGRKKFKAVIADPAQKAKLVTEMEAQIHGRGRDEFRLCRHRALRPRFVAGRLEHRGGVKKNCVAPIQWPTRSKPFWRSRKMAVLPACSTA
ncbi:MAG: hypothetical protein WDN00_17410 [Limisphaerales bacterium]